MKYISSIFLLMYLVLNMSSSVFSAEHKCLKAINALCKNRKDKKLCLKRKEMSLSSECRVYLKKAKKLVKHVDKKCVKAIQAACDIKKIMKIKGDSKKAMAEISKCVKRKEKQIQKACSKSINKMKKEAGKKAKVNPKVKK